MTMARLVFGKLTDAWKGEASDFTPLLAEQLDYLGSAIGVDLAGVGTSEVPTAGGRRIDIVAQGADGSEFVVENQYGRADHDHLTRGLAYAVARHARGLVVVAEEHRDEFRAVAQYLNDLAEQDRDRGIFIWLVEAQAVRIDDSAWAPLFTAVVQPNQFTATVEEAKRSERAGTLEEFLLQVDSPDGRDLTRDLVDRWTAAGYRRRLAPNSVVLEAPGPSVGGRRTVIAVFSDGHILVPFGSYAGSNSGIEIPQLTTEHFRSRADRLFGFNGSEKQASTSPGWLTRDRLEDLFTFCLEVAQAYQQELTTPSGRVWSDHPEGV